jgi:hypothetical protein
VWGGSPVFAALRTGTRGGKCGRCEYRELCGGCRARAYTVSGDMLAADESCAYEPTGELAVIQPRALTYGMPAAAELTWSDDARARMDRVPGFVRGVVVARVETFARERGLTHVDPALLDEIRRSMPIDFSRRAPFFMRAADTADPEES